ncbi:hypothetical protein AXF42_Ash002019 [Apostasia shenzhenica]|uniref:Uncharacterized protein n=1 Tax=Apostasia shenzhenica TaxID=1088818 RepID=A0A2I0ABW4_9ASPA|nr:hypothetical protein AXF42_Ash002019 [Apostasia shenzhenica]
MPSETSILSRQVRYAWTQITRFDLLSGTVLSYAAAVALTPSMRTNCRDISFPFDVAASVLDFISSALPPVTIVSPYESCPAASTGRSLLGYSFPDRHFG